MPNQLKAGKKRFSIALEQAPYEELNAIFTEMKAPRGTSAAMLDEFIKSQVALFRHFRDLKKQGKPVTFGEALMAVAKMHEAAGVDE